MIFASVSAMAKVDEPRILRTTIVTSWFGLLPKAMVSLGRALVSTMTARASRVEPAGPAARGLTSCG